MKKCIYRFCNGHYSLGVHRKASNIGIWGESGRYPLLYQSIKLTLKYFQRIDNMKTASIVKAALQEQKIMNLSWYENIKTLLKLDNLYHMAWIMSRHSNIYIKRKKSLLIVHSIQITSTIHKSFQYRHMG